MLYASHAQAKEFLKSLYSDRPGEKYLLYNIKIFYNIFCNVYIKTNT